MNDDFDKFFKAFGIALLVILVIALIAGIIFSFAGLEAAKEIVPSIFK